MLVLYFCFSLLPVSPYISLLGIPVLFGLGSLTGRCWFCLVAVDIVILLVISRWLPDLVSIHNRMFLSCLYPGSRYIGMWLSDLLVLGLLIR